MQGKDRVALVLAAGLVLSLVALSTGRLLGSLEAPTDQGTQVLMVLYGGIIGVLGAYMADKQGKD
jgi:hypothetical protein